jgi:glycerol uptake facilitator-like aquaporin
MKKYIGEFIGTFILILVVMTTQNWLLIGVTLGLIILIGEQFYKTSFNPASSIAHYANNDITITDFFVYIIIEIIASITAYMVYKTYIKKQTNTNNKKNK